MLLVPVRDGGPRRRRALGHALVRRDRRRARSPPTRALLTGLLRDRWGFDGTVVADYFGVAFLHLLHGVAADLGEAAGQALAAGVDVELPTGDAYLEPLAEAVRAGRGRRGARRPGGAARPARRRRSSGCSTRRSTTSRRRAVDLDSPEHRAHRAPAGRGVGRAAVQRRHAAAAEPGAGSRSIGPNADRAEALFGCYSFVNHVLAHHPGVESASRCRRCSRRCAPSCPAPRSSYARGCAVDDDDRSGFDEAVAAAAAADVAVLVVGDHAGLFGRGTVGEGCDRDDLELPGVQRELVEAVLATGHARSCSCC